MCVADAPHDATAVYLPGQTRAARIGPLRTASEWKLIVESDVAPREIDRDLDLARKLSPTWHPPDEAVDGSATFLELRTLRI
jgi:hypothetical protein